MVPQHSICSNGRAGTWHCSKHTQGPGIAACRAVTTPQEADCHNNSIHTCMPLPTHRTHNHNSALQHSYRYSPRMTGCQLQALLSGSDTRFDQGVWQARKHTHSGREHTQCILLGNSALAAHAQTNKAPPAVALSTTPLQRSLIACARLPIPTPPRIRTHVTATQHPKPRGPSV